MLKTEQKFQTGKYFPKEKKKKKVLETAITMESDMRRGQWSLSGKGRDSDLSNKSKLCLGKSKAY